MSFPPDAELSKSTACLKKKGTVMPSSLAPTRRPNAIKTRFLISGLSGKKKVAFLKVSNNGA